MDPNAAATATPRAVARQITRAWVGYFLVVTVAAIVLSVVVSAVVGLLVRVFADNPYAMRVAIMAVSILVNAPVSYLAFPWAVRGKVVPPVQSWLLSGEAQ